MQNTLNNWSNVIIKKPTKDSSVLSELNQAEIKAALGGVIILTDMPTSDEKLQMFWKNLQTNREYLLKNVQVFVAGGVKSAIDGYGFVNSYRDLQDLGYYFSVEQGNSSWINADYDFGVQGLMLRVEIPREKYDIILSSGERVNYKTLYSMMNTGSKLYNPGFLEHYIPFLEKSCIEDVFVYRSFKKRHFYSWAAKGVNNCREYYYDASGVVAKTDNVQVLLSECDSLLKAWGDILRQGLPELFVENRL